MIPSKKSELAAWIRDSLGESVMGVMPLSPSQIEDRIDDAIDYYQLFSGGIGHEQNYCIINTSTMLTSAAPVCTMTGAPFSFCDPKLAAPIMQHRAEYQLPRSVVGVSKVLPGGSGTGGLNWLTTAPAPTQEIIERALNSAEAISQTMWGGMAGGQVNTSTNNFLGLWFPGTMYNGGAYGTRGGTRADGGGMDVITYELSMEYMEMLNQRFKVTVNLDFHEASRRVRIAPPPKTAGMYIIGVWTRVAPEYLYDDYFIRHYSLALCMLQVGTTMKKYRGAKFQGGVEFDADFFFTEGKSKKEDLEKKLSENYFGYPPQAFFIG
jgi:hypothetical protein